MSKEGIYILRVPAQYLDEKADREKKEYLELFESRFEVAMDPRKRRRHIVLPAVTDELGNYLFNIEYVGPDKE